MTVHYERFTVRFVGKSDGFVSHVDMYRAFLYPDVSIHDSVGVGRTKEEAAVNLMMTIARKTGS